MANHGKTWEQLLAGIDAEILNMMNPKVVTQEVVSVLDVAVLLFSKDDFWSGTDVAAKNGNYECTEIDCGEWTDN